MKSCFTLFQNGLSKGLEILPNPQMKQDILDNDELNTLA